MKKICDFLILLNLFDDRLEVVVFLKRTIVSYHDDMSVWKFYHIVKMNHELPIENDFSLIFRVLKKRYTLQWCDQLVK